VNSRILKIVIALLGLAALICFIIQKRSAIIQFMTVLIYSFVFSTLLAPLCAKLEKTGIPLQLAPLISVLLLFLLVLIIACVFVPYLAANTLQLIKQTVPTLLSAGSAVLERLARFGLHPQNMESLAKSIITVLSALVMRIAQTGFSLTRQIGRIAFSIVISYYLLKERKKLMNYALLLLPVSKRAQCLSALLGCKNALLSYLSGLMKTSVFIAAASWICLSLLGIRSAFLLAVLMGGLEILPYVGPVLSSIPVILVALPEGIPFALICILAIVAVQQIEGNIIGPYFTASSTSIHPLLALLCVFGGGMLFGFSGIVFSVPIAVIARSLYWSLSKQGMS